MSGGPGCVAERFVTAHPKLVRFFAAGGAADEAEDLAMNAWLRCLRAEGRGQFPRWRYVWLSARSALSDHRRRQRAFGGARRALSIEAMGRRGEMLAAA